MADFSIIEQKTMSNLEDKKHTSNSGIEYWFAREIWDVLGYATWDSFQPAIDRAKSSCATFGGITSNHFHDVTKMIALGKGANRDIGDIALSRYACYLIAMNGDPTKPQIAGAQAYFAYKTHQQELYEKLTEAEKRVVERDKVKEYNKHLGDVAMNAGVKEWPLFQDAGYRGLYGGLGVRQVEEKKGITHEEGLLDCISRMELAANAFRITQTEEKLKRNHIKGDIEARKTHQEVGQEVRNTIVKIGGTMPEDLPREPSIKKFKIKQPPKELPPTSNNGGK
jgi:DNA-damage-inducible protein D